MVNSDLFKFYSYFCVRGEKLCAHDNVLLLRDIFHWNLLAEKVIEVTASRVTLSCDVHFAFDVKMKLKGRKRRYE